MDTDTEPSGVVDGYLVRSSFGAMPHYHAVQVSVHDDLLAKGAGRRHLISPDAAVTLAQNLITAAKAALGRQLWDAQAGECPTCANERFIMVVKAGHPRGVRVHCPECIPRTEQQVPTMANWAALMRAVR